MKEYNDIMIKQQVMITNVLGLHARASTKLVELANKFLSTIQIEKAHKQANAKSIMSVMMLAANKGSMLSISADGEDEAEAITQIVQLINNKFGENE